MVTLFCAAVRLAALRRQVIQRKSISIYFVLIVTVFIG
jgi:hypothetical protein